MYAYFCVVMGTWYPGPGKAWQRRQSLMNSENVMQPSQMLKPLYVHTRSTWYLFWCFSRIFRNFYYNTTLNPSFLAKCISECILLRKMDSGLCSNIYFLIQDKITNADTLAKNQVQIQISKWKNNSHTNSLILWRTTLSSLGMLYFNSAFARQLSFDALIHDFANNKARKVRLS